jgi:hypothetical protein
MRVFCNAGPGRTEEARRLAGRAPEGLTACRQLLAGVARCPRCGGELLAGVRRAAAGAFCHCPVRRVQAEAA